MAEINVIQVPIPTIEITFPVTPGCYLTFDTVSEGTLFVHWSETVIPGAIAYFSPKKPVPAFKYKQYGGRTELIRGFRGATRNRFFMGICQFAKQCKDLNGELALLSPMISVHVRGREGVVSPFPLGTLIPMANIQAISAMGQDKTCFKGVDRMAQDYFVGTGVREGGALAL